MTLDELDELQKECNINEYGDIDENGHYIFKRFREILATQVQEAKIQELEYMQQHKEDVRLGSKSWEWVADRLAQLRSTQ